MHSNTAFTLDGTNTRVGFRANLPLANMTGCQALSSVRAELSLRSACDTAMHALFDKTLNVYMKQLNTGFVHMVDWTCLLRLKLLGSGGLLPDSSTSHTLHRDRQQLRLLLIRHHLDGLHGDRVRRGKLLTTPCVFFF